VKKYIRLFHTCLTRRPTAGQFDNSEVMDELMQLRQEEANMLGFETTATVSLAIKLAKDPEQKRFIHFLKISRINQWPRPSKKKKRVDLTQFVSNLTV